MTSLKRLTRLKILTYVVALTFFITGASKLGSVAPSPENFTRWGLSQNFMMFIGAVEVLGALGLLIRRLAPIAAFGLACTMAGALRTGVVFKEALHIVLPAILIIFLALICIGHLKERR